LGKCPINVRGRGDATKTADSSESARIDAAQRSRSCAAAPKSLTASVTRERARRPQVMVGFLGPGARTRGSAEVGGARRTWLVTQVSRIRLPALRAAGALELACLSFAIHEPAALSPPPWTTFCQSGPDDAVQVSRWQAALPVSIGRCRPTGADGLRRRRACHRSFCATDTDTR